MRWFSSYLGMLGFVLAASVQAQVFPIAGAVSERTRPQVTYSPELDRHLVVWEQGGEVYGRWVEADGTTLAPFPILSRHVAGSYPDEIFYAEPAVGFKTGQNLFVVAATEILRVYAGPAYLDTFGIALVFIDQDGVRRNDQYLRTLGPGVREPRRPAVAADTHGRGCCIMVAWEDAITRRLHGQRLKANASLHGSQLVLASPSAARAVNPALIYQRLRDHFLLTFEVESDVGVTSVVARRVPASSGAAGTELRLADKTHRDRRADHPEGRPRGVYSAERDTYVVTWFDEPWVWGAFINGDALTHTAAWRVPAPLSCAPPHYACLFQPRAVDAPTPVAVDGGFRVMFSEMHPWDATNTRLVSYTVTPGTGGSASISSRVLVGYSTDAKRAVSAAYSTAADRVLVAWLRETGSFTSHEVVGMVFEP
jgi:hypothetical protein